MSTYGETSTPPESGGTPAGVVLDWPISELGWIFRPQTEFPSHQPERHTAAGDEGVQLQSVYPYTQPVFDVFRSLLEQIPFGSAGAPKLFVNDRFETSSWLHLGAQRWWLRSTDRTPLQQYLVVVKRSALSPFGEWPTSAAKTQVEMSIGAPARGSWAEIWAPSAVSQSRDLQRWLNLNVDEVAHLVGASRSAVLYWRREDATPRPKVARNLARVHALLRALRNVTTTVGFNAALRARPDGWGQSTYDLLMRGAYDQAEDLLRTFLFTSPKPSTPPWSSQIAEWPGDEQAPSGGARTPRTRKPVKVAARTKLRRRD